VRCFGAEGYGEVSGPNAYPGSEIVQLTAGGQDTCALRVDGSVRCWGISEFDLSQLHGELASISASNGLLCGVRADGSYTCIGRNALDSRALIVTPPGQ
jgi:hypothetical protein